VNAALFVVVKEARLVLIKEFKQALEGSA